MLEYLLDTNIVSEFMRPKPNAKVLARFKQNKDAIAVPAVGWHELWYGVKRLEPSPKQEALEAFLERVLAPSVVVLPYDARAAEWHATERARLTRLGKIPPFADGQIAAIAYVNDLVLVTLNISDYENFQGVEIQDWSR